MGSDALHKVIAAAVEHLRTPSMDRAEEEARKLADRYRLTLEESGWDMEVSYPYPKHNNAEFKVMAARRNMALRLTTADVARNGGLYSRRPNTPNYRAWNPKAIEHLVSEARDNASQQYDAFIAKLAGKIEADGPVVEAILTGEHIWGHSILTVCHADGSVHKWRTEMIINVSKLGTLFNQWPTRKLKPTTRKAA